jgi:hypothetical protein
LVDKFIKRTIKRLTKSYHIQAKVRFTRCIGLNNMTHEL